jgi:hypothetical protein
LFSQTESNTLEDRKTKHEKRQKSAIVSTIKDAAHRTASTNTHAKPAEAQPTASLRALPPPGIEQHRMRPKYL